MPLPRPACAVLLQPVVPAKLRWNLRKVRAERDFLDQFQFRVPVFGLVRVLEARESCYRWMVVEKECSEGPNRPASLADLFEGRRHRHHLAKLHRRSVDRYESLTGPRSFQAQ